MVPRPLRWICLLDGVDIPSRALVGGKAWSIASIGAQGFDVPPAFVVTTEAYRAFAENALFPDGLVEELTIAIAWLERESGKTFGHGKNPLLVSVRSGAAVSMPGMMDTVLNLGINDEVEMALAQASGDAAFARNSHTRFLQLYASIVLKADVDSLTREQSPAQWREAIERLAEPVPQDPVEHLMRAIRAVFQSWNSRRARRYRDHHGISHDIGTAVTVQAMVFGNLDQQSGTGVLFSRNPTTGDPEPFGEYLRCAQGEDVVSGVFTPEPLSALLDSLPQTHDHLLCAADALESAAGEVQDIEFTVERGRLYLLQTRAAKLAPYASAKIAVDMVEEGRIDRRTALLRLQPDRIRQLLSPRLAEGCAHRSLAIATGEGACPGVGIGRVVTDPDEAERRAAAGESVVLARKTTSPNDLHGMIAAVAVITEEGGSTSHSAVVSRALGKPCVVGCGPDRLLPLAGTLVTVDGGAGTVFEGALPLVTPREQDDPVLASLLAWAERAAPLQVVCPADAEAGGAFDLNAVEGGTDPAVLESLLRTHQARGARGGCIASDEGVRAAVAAGLDFVVAEPRLPTLLAALHADAARTERPST